MKFKIVNSEINYNKYKDSVTTSSIEFAVELQGFQDLDIGEKYVLKGNESWPSNRASVVPIVIVKNKSEELIALQKEQDNTLQKYHYEGKICGHANFYPESKGDIAHGIEDELATVCFTVYLESHIYNQIFDIIINRSNSASLSLGIDGTEGNGPFQTWNLSDTKLTGSGSERWITNFGYSAVQAFHIENADMGGEAVALRDELENKTKNLDILGDINNNNIMLVKQGNTIENILIHCRLLLILIIFLKLLSYSNII